MDGVVVVGAGYWGMKYVKILNKMGILKAVVDVNYHSVRAGIRAVAGNNVNIYDSHEAISIDDFEGVIICTPPTSHVEIAKYFLEEGKHVLIEKPIGTSYKEVLELYPYKDKVMPGLIYLYNPIIHKIKDYIECNSVNHIFFRRTSHGPIRPWQNAMWDLAPHDISISNYFMDGEPINYQSFYDKDWAMIDLEYIGGIHSLIYVSWLGYPKTRNIEVVLNDVDPNLISSDQIRYGFDEMKHKYEVGKSPLELMLNVFLSKTWKYGYEEGLSTVKILEELSRSV